ncbi:MAG: mannose-1-phosphate guanylyltransferase [Muribaculaceae bacterium]|nr:mannose-1-phosphate guanylyltransferase [Muribaculaceae bacterium]
MENKHRYCVIMCGGIGSRFWPYSRTDRPKQFIDFLGTGRSLLQMTYDRIRPIIPEENILVITNERYAGLVKEQLPSLADSQILLEPERRNTAPCIAWATYHIAALDPEASVIVAASDHLITREREFEKSILDGFDFVEKNDALLTLGIKPTRPETGYGYIQIGLPAAENINYVKTFTEKPNLELAKVFVDSGEFYWNSGIFLWSVRSIKNALMTYVPDLTRLFDKGLDCFATPREQEFINENFAGCINISIDFAVIEKANNVFVEPVTFGWSDLGTWSSLRDNSPKNSDGNVTQNCEVLSFNSTGNIFAIKNDKLVVVEGLKDYIIADAGDVLLVWPLSEEQKLRQVVNDVKILYGEKYL